MYEWISQLGDDETATPIRHHSGYFVTDKGRVYSTISNRWLKDLLMTATKRRPNPYTYQVKLDGYSTHIHTLVGRHFCEGYQPGLNILHKDETLPYPQINYADNLYIGTQADNNRDKFQKKRHDIQRDALGRFTSGANCTRISGDS